jgi:PTH1 family peptidyl-tRNA hydrolase
MRYNNIKNHYFYEEKETRMGIFDIFKEMESKQPKAQGAPAFLIVGLGNPGKEYEWTRHNAGFLTLDRIAQKCGVCVNEAKYKALIANATLGGVRVLLMKPQTFMNLSGEAVREAAQFYHLTPQQILVISDDVSLDVGALRVRRKGSDGGHNGLKSIAQCLGSTEFPRVRIGVGKNEYPDLVDWVLGQMPRDRRKTWEEAFERAVGATEIIVQGKIDLAMNQYNQSVKEAK